MSGYIVSPKVDEDIFEVWRYLYAQAGIEVANRVETEIYGAFETLAQNLGISVPIYLPTLCCSSPFIHI
ncbi:MAG: type II toxin-antitoxin system RelE/ParE family toxin [Bryobacteraceae bacterium]|jgi:plasmid stabilization system protein ParE